MLCAKKSNKNKLSNTKQMSNTTLIKVLIHLLVKLVVRQAKQLDLLLVNAKN